MPNTQNLKRDAGPGRPKGSKNKMPRSLKASIVKVLEMVVDTNPELIEKAVLRGLAGKPRESFPFLQMAAHYLDGKPAETLQVKAPPMKAPYVIIPPVPESTRSA